jgi:hypothetical protein
LPLEPLEPLCEDELPLVAPEPLLEAPEPLRTVTVGALLEVSWPINTPTPKAIRSVAITATTSIADGRLLRRLVAGALVLVRPEGMRALKRGAPRRVPHSTQ